MDWIASLLLLALGDATAPGERNVSHEFVVTGLAAFPDFEFHAYPTDMSGASLPVREGEGFRFYRFAKPRLFAVPKGRAPGTKWCEDPATPRSEVTLEWDGAVPRREATRRIVSHYRVAGIEGAVLRLELERVERQNGLGRPVRRGDVDPAAFLLAIAVTLLVETAFVAIALRRSLPGIALLAAGGSLVSLPLLWLLVPLLPAPLSLLLFEAGVVLFEAAIYRRLGRQPWRTALPVSLAANLLSIAAGYGMQLAGAA